MTMPDDVTVLVQSIIENAQRLGLTWTLTPGTVSDTPTGSALVIVTVDGDATTIGAFSLIGILDPTVRVMVLTTANGNYIIGLYGSTNNPVYTPTLLNGWVNFGFGFAPATYWRDTNGVVHLQGLIAGGTITIGTPLFNLPVGFRPSEQLLFAVNSNNIFARVDVASNGNVLAENGVTANWISLSSISFLATQ